MDKAIPDVERNTIPSYPVVDKPIWVKDLTKQFGDQVVVKGITFEVSPGTVFGFIGPSGSGKTTTMRMLTGIYHPTSGEVKVLGHAPGIFPRSERERIGYMPQNFVLYPDLSVWENLNFAAQIYGVGFGRSKRMRELLDFVELLEHRNKRVRHISGGMQRRLSLATTLTHKPELLFLDEPTTGLDPILRKKFWDYFHNLKENGTTVFVTTQTVSDADQCDLVGLMVEGRLVAVDTPEGLRRQALGGEVILLSANDRIEYQHRQLLTQLPFVKRAESSGESKVHVTVEDAATAIPELVEWSKNNRINVESIQQFIPNFDDVFVMLIHKESENAKI